MNRLIGPISASRENPSSSTYSRVRLRCRNLTLLDLGPLKTIPSQPLTRRLRIAWSFRRVQRREPAVPGGLPRGVLLALGLLALGVLVFTYFDLRDQRPWKRVVLLGLRALALGGALLLLLEPALELRHVSKIRNHVVVLLDDSLSMTLPDDEDRTRWEEAALAVADARERFAQPDEDHYFELFRFGETVRPSSPDDLAGAAPESRGTLLLEALTDLADRYPAASSAASSSSATAPTAGRSPAECAPVRCSTPRRGPSSKGSTRRCTPSRSATPARCATWPSSACWSTTLPSSETA